MEKATKIPLFRRCVIQNFPFIEEDFDALTDYGLLCKVVEYLNKVIEQTNTTSTQVEELSVAFNTLKDYVDHYFDNLNIQEEVNNKLDEMVESGELGELVQIAISLINYHKSVFVENIINNTSTTVACAGDSLTWCQKPNTPSQQLTTWSNMLQTFINSWYNNNNLLTMENYGVGGTQSADSITNFNTYIQNDPDTIFWAYGTNDMTHGVTVDQFLDNLKAFYQKCVDNSIELIVIIAPPSYQSMERRQKMFNLRNAEVAFCEKYGIRYINMFDYVENLYFTNSAKTNVLQSDSTHFSDYTCYRDAILSELFPCVFNQSNKNITYVPLNKTRNYLHTNGNESTADMNILGVGYRFREGQEENYITINMHLNKKSKVYFLTYGNRSAGKIDVTIDNGATTTINTQLDPTNSSASASDLQEALQLGGVINAGLHQITLNNPDYTDSVGSGNAGRIYVFGFVIEEVTELNIVNRYYQFSKQSILWSGTATSLSAVAADQTIGKYNKIILEFGNATNGLSFVELYPHDIFNQFTGTQDHATIPYNFLVNNSGTVECCTLTIDHTNNTISFTSGDGSIPLRKVIGVVSNETQGYGAENVRYIESGINYQ